MAHPVHVLWVCNVMPPQAAKALKQAATPVGGWLEGLLEDLLKKPEEVKVTICFPMPGTTQPVRGTANGFDFYGFSCNLKKLDRYDETQERQFQEILAETKPDLLHVFGTEYPHSLAAVKAFGAPERTMIHIQGLVSVYALHFMADLPRKVQRQRTFRDFLRRENLLKQQQKFVRRGEYERQAILLSGHIMGRTDWDKACTGQINPDAVYHLCNETMRSAFYREENRWSLDQCEKHSIFLSQGSYPIKGLHYVLEAMPVILRQYPDTMLYVAGEDISRDKTVKDRMRQSAYSRYICRLLDSRGLREHVVFTGFLDEEQMCGRYRKSHVFVCPSAIENSPNSVGEAMLLGMPVISSDVGGVKTMLTHEKEGLIYPASAPYMLADDVCRIFGDDVLARTLGNCAAEKAAGTHSRGQNAAQVLNVYRELC